MCNQSEYMCCFQLWTYHLQRFCLYNRIVFYFPLKFIFIRSIYGQTSLWSLFMRCVTVTRPLTLIPSCHVSLSLVRVVPLQWHRGFSTSPSSRWCSWYLSTVAWRGGGAQSSANQLTPSLWRKARQEQLTFSLGLGKGGKCLFCFVKS